MKFHRAFDKAEPRPEEKADRALKKNYAENLSRGLAILVADELRGDFREITPSATGVHQESLALGAGGPKKLDVNYSTPELGLGLGISIKTINFRDATTKRYTKNFTRVDNELRAEALDYHRRQPYSLLVGLVFVPIDACDDRIKTESSFGQAVQVFRGRGGRLRPTDAPETFEGLYLGLYDYALIRSGRDDFEACRFFDVMMPPPRLTRPAKAQVLDLAQLREKISKLFLDRNKPDFEWAD